ncbi:MAG TPA: hypothetical protein VKR82_15955 [Candidatus Acidoferrales bacterium]|nr:hypothetical protein [Candidatus Acidoferrales bacterium]
MAMREHCEVEMIRALGQMEEGRIAADAWRELGVSKYIIYLWNAKYGRMRVGDAPPLDSLGCEPVRTQRCPALLLPSFFL